jgi:hypothetical protein
MRPDELWEPHGVTETHLPRQCGRSLEPNVLLNLSPRLRMSGAFPHCTVVPGCRHRFPAIFLPRPLSFFLPFALGRTLYSAAILFGFPSKSSFRSGLLQHVPASVTARALLLVSPAVRLLQFWQSHATVVLSYCELVAVLCSLVCTPNVYGGTVTLCVCVCARAGRAVLRN